MIRELSKKIVLFLMIAIVAVGAVACVAEKENVKAPATDAGSSDSATEAPEPTEAPKQTLKVYGLKGPTGMGMAKLMADSKDGKTANIYDITIAGAPTEVTAEIIAGRFDIAAVPTNVAATLYNKTKGKIKIAAVNTLGVLYVLENGNTINSIQDLKGKTIGATGQGSTPEYVLNYILTSNGLIPGEDVEIEYYTEHSELVTQMVSGNVAIGMLPQPNVQTALAKNTDLRIALDLTAEWDVLEGDSVLMQGCIVVSEEMANNKIVLNQFLKEYKASAEYVNNEPEAAAKLIAEAGIIPSEGVAKAAIPSCNIVYIDGEEMETKLSGFLEVLFEANKASVGGALPDDNFYYDGTYVYGE